MDSELQNRGISESICICHQLLFGDVDGGTGLSLFLFDHHHPTLTLDMSDLDADLYGGEPHFSFCILLVFDEEI